MRINKTQKWVDLRAVKWVVVSAPPDPGKWGVVI